MLGRTTHEHQRWIVRGAYREGGVWVMCSTDLRAQTRKLVGRAPRVLRQSTRDVTAARCSHVQALVDEWRAMNREKFTKGPNVKLTGAPLLGASRGQEHEVRCVTEELCAARPR
jgi:hypothetical protein